nr:LuxR C-terminal-related transcriptional regulator [Vitiosangium sp. GDMCC 1.1324]
MPNKQIVHQLGTTEKTLKVHRGRVIQTLGVNSVAELVRLVDRLGRG